MLTLGFSIALTTGLSVCYPLGLFDSGRLLRGQRVVLMGWAEV